MNQNESEARSGKCLPASLQGPLPRYIQSRLFSLESGLAKYTCLSVPRQCTVSKVHQTVLNRVANQPRNIVNVKFFLDLATVRFNRFYANAQRHCDFLSGVTFSCQSKH